MASASFRSCTRACSTPICHGQPRGQGNKGKGTEPSLPRVIAPKTILIFGLDSDILVTAHCRNTTSGCGMRSARQGESGELSCLYVVVEKPLPVDVITRQCGNIPAIAGHIRPAPSLVGCTRAWSPFCMHWEMDIFGVCLEADDSSVKNHGDWHSGGGCRYGSRDAEMETLSHGSPPFRGRVVVIGILFPALQPTSRSCHMIPGIFSPRLSGV